jgi:hypothetical protein
MFCSITVFEYIFNLDDKAEAEVVMRNKAVKISYKTMGKYRGSPQSGICYGNIYYIKP